MKLDLAAIANLAVGSPVYVLDRYGRIPITFDHYLRSWRAHEVRDVTRDSLWVGPQYAPRQYRINRKTGEVTEPGGDDAPNVRLSLDGLREEWDTEQWVSTNVYRIADRVRFVRDIAVLREVARLVGYEAKETA